MRKNIGKLKKVIALSMAFAVTGTFVACNRGRDMKGLPLDTSSVDTTTTTVQSTEAAIEEDVHIELVERPTFLKSTEDLYKSLSFTPSVPKYKVDGDFSNVTNYDRFWFDAEENELLKNNLFFVTDSADSEFFEIYEYNRYRQLPNFVTVDSMMHTYHLYFSHLLNKTEKLYLADDLMALSKKMLEESKSNYEIVKGTDWESAAARNVAFFTIGACLQDSSVEIEPYVEDIVKGELSKINAAGGIEKCAITDDYEDYSQYKPRGYYEGDEVLEKYFRTMMWYGRIQYSQNVEELNRSAFLLTVTMMNTGITEWGRIYAVTSFFAGASDDLGYYEYSSVIDAVYGDTISFDEKKWNQYKSEIAKLEAPRINSIPIMDGEDNVIKGFRFMGQRFSIDEDIFGQLIYSNVKEDSNNNKRMLPCVLDVPAALGSDVALSILEDQGDTDYAGYSENMNSLRSEFAEDNEETKSLFTASLYANWLNTLRPLLEEKGDGYPSFMTNDEWTKKDLETFAGSYTELKHDTVLYSKQVMAEMGGGDDEVLDDRGYVEPEPLVYTRFKALSKGTMEGLKKYNVLSSEDEEGLELLSSMADKLINISNKELKNESLTDDEYEFIRFFGGDLEHLWKEIMKYKTGEEYVSVDEHPASLVTDIATDPNGTILEAGNGTVSSIYVIVPVEGKLRIARGSVYTFYEFERPMSEGRLTDTEWRLMMGIEADENMIYDKSNRIDQPEWTNSYRYEPKY